MGARRSLSFTYPDGKHGRPTIHASMLPAGTNAIRIRPPVVATDAHSWGTDYVAPTTEHRAGLETVRTRLTLADTARMRSN